MKAFCFVTDNRQESSMTSNVFDRDLKMMMISYVDEKVVVVVVETKKMTKKLQCDLNSFYFVVSSDPWNVILMDTMMNFLVDDDALNVHLSFDCYYYSHSLDMEASMMMTTMKNFVFVMTKKTMMVGEIVVDFYKTMMEQALA
jgi:hypothetical protein